MTEALLVTLRRRPIPNGGYHFMFVDHRDRAGFVPADQVPRIVGDTVVAEVTPMPSRHWPRWTAKAVLPLSDRRLIMPTPPDAARLHRGSSPDPCSGGDD